MKCVGYGSTLIMLPSFTNLLNAAAKLAMVSRSRPQHLSWRQSQKSYMLLELDCGSRSERNEVGGKMVLG